MTVTSSGIICDVCGNYILPIDETEKVHSFKNDGLDGVFHCDNKCKELLILIRSDWHKLPQEGLLFKIFNKINTEK